MIEWLLAVFYYARNRISGDFFNTIDPFLPLALLESGQSAKATFITLANYKAAVGELNQAANTCRSIISAKWQVKVR